MCVCVRGFQLQFGIAKHNNAATAAGQEIRNGHLMTLHQKRRHEAAAAAAM